MEQRGEPGEAPEHGLGGDPPCWLDRVCDNCGRFIDDEFADACPRCGARRASASNAAYR